MSHELAFRADGSAAMAYVGATPWHGMGQTLVPGAPLDVWTEAAGLNWSALVVPSQYEYNGGLIVSDNAFHMVRSDTGASLSVMSSRYTPAQPADIMAFMRDFVLTDSRFVMETAGALKGGNVIWALARYADNMSINGDDHACYAFITTSFDGSLATTVQCTTVRVVCNNTLTAAVYDKRAAIKVRHSRDFGSAPVRADAANRLAQVAGGFAQYKAIGEALAHVAMTVEETVDFFKRLTIKSVSPDGKVSGKSRNQLDALVNAYTTTLSEGTRPNNGWAAWNAVTRYVDHDKTVRDTTGDGNASARMASNLIGSGAALKREALDELARMGSLVLEGLGIDTSLSAPIQPAEVEPIAEFDHQRAGSALLASMLG